jgi:hypothetical protein
LLAAAAALTVGSLGVLAGTASAAPDGAPNPNQPLNYGDCVSSDFFDFQPSQSDLGPLNTRSSERSGRSTGAVNGAQQSGGKSRFDGGGVACQSPK